MNFTTNTNDQSVNSLALRPITGREELDLFCRLPYALNEELANDLALDRRRPEWMWVALLGDRLVARVAWWSRPGHGVPQILDIVDVEDGVTGAERTAVGVRLLRTAMAAVLPGGGARPPEYSRFVPPDWRADAVTRQAVEDRMDVLEQVGAQLFVERLRLEWVPESGVPETDARGRLAFRPPADTEELVSLMTGVLDGTLDAHSRHDLTRMSARKAAVQPYEDELALYPSPREWWRVATLPGGEPVGFVVPAHNGYNPIIAYIGVLPDHRGRGYIDGLLGEGTRVLAEQGVPRIRASTDVGNVPMANAFRRAGYVNFGEQIDMTWSCPSVYGG
ncbi:GCN5-related N-acetyltransferase [Actinobacteria bacterium OK074]|nr:GCN5-related N-acetyltransferase [Actinobacteria bacterium OK074]